LEKLGQSLQLRELASKVMTQAVERRTVEN